MGYVSAGLWFFPLAVLAGILYRSVAVVAVGTVMTMVTLALWFSNRRTAWIEAEPTGRPGGLLREVMIMALVALIVVPLLLWQAVSTNLTLEQLGLVALGVLTLFILAGALRALVGKRPTSRDGGKSDRD